MLEVFGLLLLAISLWLWHDSLKAREAGVRASRSACQAHGVLFLDDTIAIGSIWLARDDYGRLKLRRVYTFEYSDTGNNRCRGAVTLVGDEVVTLHLGPPPLRAL